MLRIATSKRQHSAMLLIKVGSEAGGGVGA